MQTPLERLRALERRYTGPVPKAPLDAALYATPPDLRTARDRVRFYQRWLDQAVEASVRWRAAAAHGDYDRLTASQNLVRRVSLARAMLQTARQCLRWKSHLRELERHYSSSEKPG